MTDLVIMYKHEEYRKIIVDGYGIEFVPLYKTEPNYSTHLIGSFVTVTRDGDGDTMTGSIDFHSSEFSVIKQFDSDASRRNGNLEVHDEISFFLKNGFLSIQIEEVDDGCKYCVL
jgi:hypothetical protein